MQPERILVSLRDDVEPVQFGELISSSDGSSWSGFLVECHRIPETGNLFRFASYHHLVTLCVAGRGTARIRCGASSHRFALEPGTLSIFAGGCEFAQICWSGTHEVLLVDVSRSRLARWTMHEHEDGEPDLVSQFGIKDPQLAALMGNIHAEIEDGCPIGGGYGESLSLALTDYLFGRYSAARRRSADQRMGLSLAQVKRVQEYVHAHMAEDLSVSRLAGVVQLSPRHFSLLFKNSVGVTPHRYVLAKRINRARTLLATGRHSILETAVSLGFASQSHFSDVFRRLTGVTPGQYRRKH